MKHRKNVPHDATGTFARYNTGMSASTRRARARHFRRGAKPAGKIRVHIDQLREMQPPKLEPAVTRCVFERCTAKAPSHACCRSSNRQSNRCAKSEQNGRTHFDIASSLQSRSGCWRTGHAPEPHPNSGVTHASTVS